MSNNFPNHEGKVVVTLQGGSEITLNFSLAKQILISTPQGDLEIIFEQQETSTEVPVLQAVEDANSEIEEDPYYKPHPYVWCEECMVSVDPKVHREVHNGHFNYLSYCHDCRDYH